MTTLEAAAASSPPRPRELATPPGGWLLGHYREFMRDKLAAVTRYARQHGDLVALRLGPLKVVMVSDPELIEEVFVSRAREFAKGAIEQLVRPSVGNGILLSEGDYWKRQRRMVAPPFHRQKLAGYGEVMVGVAERMTSGFADGEVRDLFPVTTNIALAVAAKTMFDVDVDNDAGGIADALTAMMRAVNARVDAAVPLPDFVPTPTMLRLRRARAKLDTVLYRAIAERRAAATPGDDLLSLLLSVRDEDDGRGMTDLQLRDEAMTLFIAGFETTAISLSWIIHVLSTHPEVDTRLREQVRSVVGDRLPKFEDLPAAAGCAPAPTCGCCRGSCTTIRASGPSRNASTPTAGTATSPRSCPSLPIFPSAADRGSASATPSR